MLVTLRMQLLLYEVLMVGQETPVIFSAVLRVKDCAVPIPLMLCIPPNLWCACTQQQPLRTCSTLCAQNIPEVLRWLP